jgi:hypothetical protein
MINKHYICSKGLLCFALPPGVGHSWIFLLTKTMKQLVEELKETTRGSSLHFFLYNLGFLHNHVDSCGAYDMRGKT